MVADKKGKAKNDYMKRSQKPNHCAKDVMRCRILKARKKNLEWLRGKAKGADHSKAYTI